MAEVDPQPAGPGPVDFEEAFEPLAAVAYRTAHRILGSRQEAEDVAQEALARAYVRWRTVQHHATPWVARVAANEAIDRWRRRRPATELGAVGAVVAGEVAGPEDRDLVVAALRAIPRRQREVVVLRHLVGLTEREVATELGLSVGSVKQHAHRGLARLRPLVGVADADAPRQEDPDVRSTR